MRSRARKSVSSCSSHTAKAKMPFKRGKTVGAPFYKGGEQHFGIGMCLKAPAPLRECMAQLGRVVKLAVIYDGTAFSLSSSVMGCRPFSGSITLSRLWISVQWPLQKNPD